MTRSVAESAATSGNLNNRAAVVEGVVVRKREAGNRSMPSVQIAACPQLSPSSPLRDGRCTAGIVFGQGRDQGNSLIVAPITVRS